MAIRSEACLNVQHTLCACVPVCLNVQHTGTCHSLVGRNRKGTRPCRVRDRITICLKGDIKSCEKKMHGRSEKNIVEKCEK